MGHIISMTLPLYALIGLGFLAARSRYVTAADLAGVSAVVMRIFLPAMIFAAIAGRPLAESMRPGFVAAYLAAGLSVLAIGFLLARLAGQPFTRAAIEGMGASCPNSSYFGLPLVTLALGAEVALQGFALAVLVENLFVIPLAIALCDMGEGMGQAGGVRRFLGGLIRNPLLLAVAAGLGWAATGLPLPDLPGRVLAMMSPVAAPAVLIAIGGAMAGMSLAGQTGGAARVVLGKLILHPLLAFAAVWLFAPDLETGLRQAVVLYAASPMMTIYTLFGQRYGAPALSVTAMVGAITASIVTVPAAIWLLQG